MPAIVGVVRILVADAQPAHSRLILRQERHFLETHCLASIITDLQQGRAKQLVPLPVHIGVRLDAIIEAAGHIHRVQEGRQKVGDGCCRWANSPYPILEIGADEIARVRF